VCCGSDWSGQTVQQIQHLSQGQITGPAVASLRQALLKATWNIARPPAARHVDKKPYIHRPAFQHRVRSALLDDVGRTEGDRGRYCCNGSDRLVHGSLAAGHPARTAR